jgi:hypothetical protein
MGYDMDVNGLRVGVVYWVEKSEEITASLCWRLERLGCEVVNLAYNARLPQGLDVVVVQGPYGSLSPLGNQLIACPQSQCPALVYLMSEQLPNPDLPEWLRYAIGLARSRIERFAFRQQAAGEWRPHPSLKWLTAKGHRFKYYGDLYWMRRQGILSVLGVWSRWTADWLRTRGFDPVVLTAAHLPGPQDDLKIERDIPVLWLGKTGSARRGRLLERVRADLRERGVELLVIDGAEHPYVFGEKRAALLSRTKIVLNILREKWDDNSMRFALAIPRRALIVTEPMLPHTDFLPGVHLVEARVEQMADTMCYYLSHEEERRQIVEQAYELITRQPAENLVSLLRQAVIARQKETTAWKE